MASSFKVEKLSAVNNLAKNKTINKLQQNNNNSSLGEVAFALTSLSVLTYSSHALIEILTCYFDNDTGLPPYALAEKALQILSQPITDDILKSDLNALILKNIHKKQDTYVFFCLWAQYLPIQDVLSTVNDKKLQEKIVYTILVTYLGDCSKSVIWYESLALQSQLKNLISSDSVSKNSRVFEEIQAQITNLSVQNHHHFKKVLNKLIKLVKISVNLPVFSLVKKLPINFLKSKTNQKFINQMSEGLLAAKRLSSSLQNSEFSNFLEYINQPDLKQVKQLFDASLRNKLEDKINSEKNEVFYDFAYSVFDENQSYGTQKFLKFNLKNLFVNSDKNKLWKFFDSNFHLYNFLTASNDFKQKQQKRGFMMKFMGEISKQNENTGNQVNKMIYSKYFYHFLEGKGFNFSEELKFLESKKSMKFDHERQVIGKGFKHIKNEKWINLMTLNKSNFPECLNWPVDLPLSEMAKKYQGNSLMKKVLTKTKEYWGRIEEDMLKENKKIELAYSVFRIEIDKKPICLRVEQLFEIIKQYSEGKNIDLEALSITSYRSEYSPINFIKEKKLQKSILVQKEQQQLHPIIIQAKIIKLMKKQLKKASIKQISVALNLNPQKTHQTVKKLVTKGYLEEHQDQKYSYEA